MSVDFLLGIAVGGIGYFLLDNGLYPRLAHFLAHRSSGVR